MSSKLRESLSKAGVALSWATHGHLTEYDAEKYLAIVDAALAEPLKNCEVGTIEEQDLRFNKFCGSHIGCGRCPLSKLVYSCTLTWAQMPYESEVK